jgi:predicted metalloprotease with PDZ domain
LYWDYRLRGLGKGAHDLDDVMLAMKARVAPGTDQTLLATVLLSEEMQKAGYPISGDVARFVERGEAIELPNDIFEPCGELVTSDVAEFDRGFDADQTSQNANVIVGLRDDSPGFQAGLRNGMKILRREAGKPGDSRVALTYRVQDATGERTITYLPEGRRRIRLQEIVLSPEMGDAQRGSCAARLAGLPVPAKPKSWYDFMKVF